MSGLPAAASQAPLRSIHVVAGLDAQYGGPSYTVPRLCAALDLNGVEASLLSVAGASEPPSDRVREGYREIHARWSCARVPVLSHLRLSTGLSSALREFTPSMDLVHGHGLWLMPNVAASLAARRASKPFVLSPKGMLLKDALVISSRRKALFWRLFQGPALKDVACIHATSELEYQSIRDWGLTAPVAIIPHGIDLPPAGKALDTPSGDLREVLYLGRLHPRKRLDALIEAWAQIDPKRRSGWRLRIVGPTEDGYDQALKALVGARSLTDVSIEGPLYDQFKFHAYQQADLFVLPSQNENFGIAVAEALASGTPVLCTRGAPWSGLVSERCGWWVDFATVPLREALAAAMSTPVEDLRQMGQRGRDWMSREYSWMEAGRRMRVVYEWLKNGGKAPADVVLD